jgi:propanol-preferring alcohol dehydrogenase
MIFEGPGKPLRLIERELPVCGPREVLVRVSACGICRTDLHIVDGDLIEPKLPLVLGHEIVGYVHALGEEVADLELEQRVGVPWLGYTCGKCSYCLSGCENLCEQARFTGYTIDGGYSEFALVDSRYCFPLATGLSDAETAPLLCAGFIGYRSYRMTGDAQRIGLYGFGAAAHIIAQVARHQGRQIFAFTRPGDEKSQSFSRSLGAVWAGDSETAPPEPLDAAIIFAPVGALVPLALKAIRPGGVVVCAGIHMSQIPQFDYELLWGERVIRSVANLTRADGLEFLALAPAVPVKTSIETFTLEKAELALECLRGGAIDGAGVLVVDRKA